MRRFSPARAGAADIARMLRPGQAIGLCVLALLVVGVVMVNSAGMTVDAKGAVTVESILLSKSTVYMGLAVGAMLVVGVMPIRRLVAIMEAPGEEAPEEPAGPRGPLGLPNPEHYLRHLLSLWPLWGAVFALLGVLGCVYLPGVGKEVNHSRRWVNLHLPGLDSVQPSEIAKWGLIAVIGWYCVRNARRMGSFWYGLIPGLAAAGMVAAFIVLEDLGTGALVGMVATIMLLAAGARLWHLVVLAPIPLAGVAAAIISNPYRVHRITSFLNPYEDPKGKGYHMIQSMAAVANGQFFGRGLGHGLQKFDYLPEDTTDFLFAIVCEELGVFGAGLVIFLYGALLWSVLTVLKREPSRLMRLIGLGVMATVGIQALINLAVVTGLGPTKGIALPLLSSGGTGWILTAASLGLVIAMDRTQGVMQWYATAAVVGEDEPRDEAPATDAGDDAADQDRAAPESAGAGPSEEDDVRFAPPIAVATAVVDGPAVHAAEQPAPVSTADDGAESAPSVAPTMEVAPGQTGLLFSEEEAARQAALRAATMEIPPAREPTPPVVVTENGREWPDSLRVRPA